MNPAGAGTFAIWVLWARQRLGLQEAGFAALVAAYAAGGLLGTPAGRRTRRRPWHRRAVLARPRRRSGYSQVAAEAVGGQVGQ
jgi:hypothetical protein